MMGEILRQGNGRHYCDTPTNTAHLQVGTIWRCDCGGRWILKYRNGVVGKDYRSPPVWRPRYWPGPK